MAAQIRLPEHSHCGFCLNPTPYGEDFCSEECRLNAEKEANKEKLNNYKFAGFVVVSLVVLVVLAILI